MIQPPRQSYLQFHVPLDIRARWYRNLRLALGWMNGMKWNKIGSFHITMAFIHDKLDTASANKVAEILDGVLDGIPAPRITFDTLEAFTGNSKLSHYVILTASQIPDEWAPLVNRVRTALTDNDLRLEPYKLHVTLGSIPVDNIDLMSLKNAVGQVRVPAFTLTLNSADYNYREPHCVIREWTFPVRP